MIATPLTERDVLRSATSCSWSRACSPSSAAYLVVIAAFGAVASWLGAARDPGRRPDRDGVLDADGGATRRRVEDDRAFVTIFRFLIVPMFLFSGTFFPVSQMPLAFELVAYVTPIWHGVELCRMLTLGDVELLAGARPRRPTSSPGRSAASSSRAAPTGGGSSK